MYLNPQQESITFKDLMIPLCARQKAFVYEIDWHVDFFKDVVSHSDRLDCSSIYLKHYAKIDPEMLKVPDDFEASQRTGYVFVHPTAEIDPTAHVRMLMMMGVVGAKRDGGRLCENRGRVQDNKLYYFGRCRTTLECRSNKQYHWMELQSGPLGSHRGFRDRRAEGARYVRARYLRLGSGGGCGA